MKEEPRCYRIRRYFYPNRSGNSRPARTIKSYVTLTEAQAHCGRDDTKEKGVYFDGYDYMKGCKP